MNPFDGIAGHRDVLDALQRSCNSGSAPAGFLLHGEPGRGRTAVARRLAALLIAGPDWPRTVRRIDSGSHPDFAMIERGEESRQILIAQIRELREWLSLRGVESDRRVAIVRDAERLTEEAGNALLKTLEEPPPGSHLVLTARGRDAVMETLKSRCQPFHLGPLSRGDVVGFLRSRGVPDGPSLLLAILAEGRPGWAIRQWEAGFEENLLDPVRTLLSCRREPFASADALAGRSKRGHKLEGAREELANWICAAMTLLRIGVRRACGASGGDGLREADPSLAALVEFDAPEEGLRLLGFLAEALDTLGKNAGIELCLEVLGLRMAELSRERGVC